MKPEEYNNIFINFQDNLNSIYEKLRLLEDLRDFIKKYIDNNIISKKEKLREKLDKAEYIINKLVNKKYLTYKTNFNSSNISTTDRDGQNISSCDILKGMITLSSKDISDVNMSSITRESNNVNYRNNIDNIRKGEPYRVYYLSDEVLNDNKLEHIVILFDKSYNFNYVNIETCNCLATDLQVLLPDGSMKDYIVEKNCYGNNINAVGIRFYLNTENYRTKEYQIDESRMDRYFYNIIEADVYSQFNQGKQLFDIESVSGMQQYQTDLNNYNTALVKNTGLKDLAATLFSLSKYVILNSSGEQLSGDNVKYTTSSSSNTTYYTGYFEQKEKYGLLIGGN